MSIFSRFWPRANRATIDGEIILPSRSLVPQVGRHVSTARVSTMRVKSEPESGTSTDRFFRMLGIGQKTRAGVNVTKLRAIQHVAVWACLNARSEDLAKLPCGLFEKLENGDRRDAVNHPLYKLIRVQPNPRNSIFEFFETMQLQVDVYGNALAIKIWDDRGQITALWPFNWEWVTVLKQEGGTELFYRLHAPGKEVVTVTSEMVLHVRGKSLDGCVGISPIEAHREAIGHSIAGAEYGAAFFGNSAQPNGALKMPQQISKDAADRIREDFKARFQGPENAHNLAIFDGGLEWVQMGMTNLDAQFLESRKYQSAEIYRIYRMPPHKVGDLDRSTNNNIEHQGIEYVQDAMGSMMARWVGALNRDLLLESEKGKYYFEFNPDALLRGDIRTRYEAYERGFRIGVLSENDIRRMENRNSIGPNGDKRYRSLDLWPIDQPPPEQTQAATQPKPKRIKRETTNAS